MTGWMVLICPGCNPCPEEGRWIVAVPCECETDPPADELWFHADHFGSGGGFVHFRDQEYGICWELNLDQEPVVQEEIPGEQGTVDVEFKGCFQCCSEPGECWLEAVRCPCDGTGSGWVACEDVPKKFVGTRTFRTGSGECWSVDVDQSPTAVPGSPELVPIDWFDPGEEGCLECCGAPPCYPSGCAIPTGVVLSVVWSSIPDNGCLGFCGPEEAQTECPLPESPLLLRFASPPCHDPPILDSLGCRCTVSERGFACEIDVFEDPVMVRWSLGMVIKGSQGCGFETKPFEDPSCGGCGYVGGSAPCPPTCPGGTHIVNMRTGWHPAGTCYRDVSWSLLGLSENVVSATVVSWTP